MAKYNNYKVKKVILFCILEYTYSCNEEIPYKEQEQVSIETSSFSKFTYYLLV